jgi:tetratricopeptide (TPR) repeat protein
MRPMLIALAAILAIVTRPSAQTGGPVRDPASQAMRTGQYEQVDKLLQNSTDPRSIALRGRALIARGRYDEAEKLLSRAATTAPTSDAALELGLLQIYLGRRQDGLRVLNRLSDDIEPKTAADALRFSRALREIGEFQNAKSAIDLAIKLAPNDPDIRAASAELFAAKYNIAEAMKDFDAALKMDEAHPEALVGVAAILVEQNPPDAAKAIELALKTNPNFERAHLLSAELALDERRRPDAHTAIEKALEVNPRSLDARALDAAISFLEGRNDEFDKKVNEVLAINPRYGELFRVVGDHLASNYRFDEAVEMVRKGLALDPDNTRAHAELGLHLLRTGDEPAARQSLERAWEVDPYDLVTFNLLDLLDRLDKFETIKDGNLVMRFDPSEAAVMREQALPFAREALDTLAKRWDIEIKGPILIEMFPKHDDFAVRNLGLPGMIGALGACFGRVVTLDSPRARPPGEYNWQPTLWHELAHVVTLQLSNNRVPRWLTEGISVWEERRARPEWGREMDVAFAQAMDQKKVIKLAELNEGFSDPTLISLAYHQASLVVEHLVATYGEASLKALLRAYGQGAETEQAFKEAFNGTIEQVQTGFDAKIEKEFAGLRAALKAPEIKETPDLEALKRLATENPGSFPVQMSLGEALQEAGDSAGAIAAFERAAKLVPTATGGMNPNRRIAEVALQQKDNARAVTALEATLRVDHADVESARKLVPLVSAMKNPARTQDAYQRLVTIDPFESSSHSALGRLAMERKDAPAAIRSFRTAIATNPPDRASAHTDLAEAYVLAGRPGDAKVEVLAALEIAPSFDRALELLLRLAEGGK